MERLIVWKGMDAERWEVAHLTLSPHGVDARGTQVGVDPVPYRLDYDLDARDDFVTRLLDVRVEGGGWSRRLVLRHNGNGEWSWDGDVNGDVQLDAPGADPEVIEKLEDARDCDLGLSPVTNLLPIRRHGLTTEGSVDIVAAWVSVPDLRLYSYRQRYEFVRRDGRGSVVRFIDRGLDEGFTSDLVLDREGLIETYPGLARRVDADESHD